MKRSEHITAFVETLWDWFDTHKRTLPWRDLQITDDTQRAYMVLVSEIMLQQTQVPRVKILFGQFLERFPTVQDLASATNKDVLMQWRGLGYNSRALRLRDAAQEIAKRGSFPTGMDDLLSINGIGHYTAAAVRNFACNLPTPCLDTNIRRILHRAFIGPENPDGTWKQDDRELLALAEEILMVAISQPVTRSSQLRDARNWHAALMDFGSIICTKRNPKWDLCPLSKLGLMKAAYKVKVDPLVRKKKEAKEPGRLVGSVFVPNRIFRGKIIETLRDHDAGLSLETIGKYVCIDWEQENLKDWLKSLITKLVQDKMIEEKGRKFSLAQ